MSLSLMLFQPRDAGTVEAEAVFERAGLERADRQAEVLPRAGKIDELEIEDACAFVFGKLENVLGSSLLHHTTL
jgi:hypothetical protein